MATIAYHEAADGTHCRRPVYRKRAEIGPGSRPLDSDDNDRREQALIARAKAGDRRAFDALVERYQALAVRAAYLACGSAKDAEDAAQEGFVKAYTALDGFRPGAPFRPWLLRIVTNEARNRARARGRRAEYTQRAAEADHGPRPDAPEGAALDSGRQGELLDAVNRLSDVDRTVIGYRYFLELSTSETAAALGVATGTVKSRLSRALDRLRAELEEPPSAAVEGRTHPKARQGAQSGPERHMDHATGMDRGDQTDHRHQTNHDRQTDHGHQTDPVDKGDSGRPSEASRG